MHEHAAHWKSGYMPLIIGGIGAMASALLMPWVVIASPAVGQINRTGLQLRGGKLFALGLVVLALAAWSESRRPSATTRTALLAGLVVLGVALAVEYRDLTRLVADFNAQAAQAKLGFGIFGTGVGLTCSVAGVLKRRLVLQPSRERTDQFVGS